MHGSVDLNKFIGPLWPLEIINTASKLIIFRLQNHFEISIIFTLLHWLEIKNSLSISYSVPNKIPMIELNFLLNIIRPNKNRVLAATQRRHNAV